MVEFMIQEMKVKSVFFVFGLRINGLSYKHGIENNSNTIVLYV